MNQPKFLAALGASLMLAFASMPLFAQSASMQPQPWSMQWPEVSTMDVAGNGNPLSSSAKSVKTKTTSSVTSKSRVSKVLKGKATYYAKNFNGRKTASGHPYHQEAYTAAHRTLPLGTWVRVTNQANQLSVVVQITDRGPYAHPNRIIDLSRRAATELDMLEVGVSNVSIEIVQEANAPVAAIERMQLVSL